MVRTAPGAKVIGINRSPFGGIAGVVFPAMAKLLAAVHIYIEALLKCRGAPRPHPRVDRQHRLAHPR